MSSAFSYREFTTRNLGFVTQPEQDRLQASSVFVCGTGGMGGACVLALARAGVGRLILADIDEFELSNLNRQVFAFQGTLGSHKAEATRDICLTINPDMKISVYNEDWTEQIDSTMRDCDIVVNGTDSLSASLLLYRSARAHGKSVIDAYASPLPSIFVTHPSDPMPEERLGYPTLQTEWHQLTPEQCQEAFLREAEYVILNSSSRKHIDLELASEVASGTRSRMSFAPMVITTGMLMAYEAIAGILRKDHGSDFRGWFLNPYSGRVERPRNALVAAVLRPLVRRFLQKMVV